MTNILCSEPKTWFLSVDLALKEASRPHFSKSSCHKERQYDSSAQVGSLRYLTAGTRGSCPTCPCRSLLLGPWAPAPTLSSGRTYSCSLTDRAWASPSFTGLHWKVLRNNSPQERGQTFNETFHKTVQVGEAERGCEYNLNEIGHLQLTLSASYELGFNGKRLHHSTTSTCGGQSGICYAQTRGGRYCVPWGSAAPDCSMPPPRAASPRAVGALPWLHSDHLGPPPWLREQPAHGLFQGPSEEATSATGDVRQFKGDAGSWSGVSTSK